MKSQKFVDEMEHSRKNSLTQPPPPTDVKIPESGRDEDDMGNSDEEADKVVSLLAA